MSNGLCCIVLTYNEESDISDCLQSLDWTDRSIVVDSGSSDSTIALAQNCGVDVVVHKMDPFQASDQRNWALENLDFAEEWVLFLDADERATPELAEKIQRELACNADGVVGYRLCPKFMFLGKWLKHTMGYPAWHDRLLRRDELRFTGVWPTDHFASTDKAIGYIREPYLHFGFTKGADRWFAKHNNYSTNIAQEIVDSSGASRDDGIHYKRKRQFESWASRRILLGTLIRFLYQLLVRRSFLDGYPGLVYSCMMASYQLMIGLKVKEAQLRTEGKSL